VKLIVGLGNPGRSYAATRHNVGWWVLDHLADVWRFSPWKRDFQSEVTGGSVAGHDVRLLKPQTYMNLSGHALAPYLRDGRVAVKTDLLVVVDDVALPVGRLRLRAEGSSGGHNGLESIEDAIGDRAYSRLRIGVGPRADRQRTSILSDYVLDRMGKEEREVIESLLPTFTDAIETWISAGITKAMNIYNRTGRSGDEDPAGEDSEESD
jgi:PTH1 family peptidyl-tRNA hydrolase